MSAINLAWARKTIRPAESFFLQFLAVIPYMALWSGLSIELLTGYWSHGSTVVGALLFTVFLKTSASKSEEERLLLYWLLALAAVVLGIVSLFAGMVVVVAKAEADWTNPLTGAGGFAMTVGAIDVLLFQVYHRILGPDPGRPLGER